MKGIFAKKKEKTFHFYPRNNSSSFKKDGRVLLERAQGYSLNGKIEKSSNCYLSPPPSER